MRFNQTELCPTEGGSELVRTEGTEPESKSLLTTESLHSTTNIPLSLLGQTTCEVLQAISRSRSDMCQVDPTSCHSMQCSIHQIRINMTILPCGGSPGVNIDAYHMLEQVTLVHEDFTKSQIKKVHFFRGEPILFHLNIIVEQSHSVPDQITFMVR